MLIKRRFKPLGTSRKGYLKLAPHKKCSTPQTSLSAAPMLVLIVTASALLQPGARTVGNATERHVMGHEEKPRMGQPNGARNLEAVTHVFCLQIRWSSTNPEQ
eukprot:scaffold128643_cov18-Prasinocladus_malaysianus.AAC.1